MYDRYRVKRKKTERISIALGLLLTVGVHGAAYALVGMKGLKYIYPPAAEQSFVLDFIEEDIPKIKNGKEPVAPDADKKKPVETVQKSKSPTPAKTPNQTQASAPDNFGDVETPAPKVEQPAPDPRASFPGMARKPSSATTPHSAQTPSDTYKDGQADGNATTAQTQGKSNAHLVGRKVEGNLVKPKYNLQRSGVVVVRIVVDIYGNVKEAVPGQPGTTLDDATLWAEARTAALKTHFTPLTNIDENTPATQQGTITYIFNLK